MHTLIMVIIRVRSYITSRKDDAHQSSNEQKKKRVRVPITRKTSRLPKTLNTNIFRDLHVGAYFSV